MVTKLTASVREGLESKGLEIEEEMPSLEDRLGFLLRCSSNIFDAVYTRIAGDLALTPSQMAVLLVLSRRGQVTQTELAKLTHIDKSTINELVPRMNERGLLVRSKSATDKRVIQLSIAPAGVALLKKGNVAAIAAQDTVLALLPVEYRRIFKHCLEMILDAKGSILGDTKPEDSEE